MIDINSDILIQSLESSNLAHTISLAQEGLPLSYVNQAFLTMTGYGEEEVLGQNCRFLQGEGTDPETIQQIRDALDEQVPIDVEILNYKKDGSSFWNRLRMAPVRDANGNVTAFIAIQVDVSEIRQKLWLEQEAQKLEALGRVAANITHEVKNVIQPISLMSEELTNWKDMSEAHIEKCLHIIRENVSIAETITQDTLSLSKSQEVRENAGCKKHSAEDICEQISGFIHTLIPQGVGYKVSIDEDLKNSGSLNVHQSRLYQVILNIVNNAVHAMHGEETRESELSLEAKKVEIKAAQAKDLSLKTGTYVCISILDNGGGMDEFVVQSIFEPFFSTKAIGEGTGLGMSISYQIIREWEGTITAQNKEADAKGQRTGSIFSIYLPLYKDGES